MSSWRASRIGCRDSDEPRAPSDIASETMTGARQTFLGPDSDESHETTRASAAQSSSSPARPAERAQVKLAALLGSPVPLYLGQDGHSQTGRVRPLVAAF